EGWDRKLVMAAGRDKIAYCDDGIWGERHAARYVVGGDLAREIGWLLLPGTKRLYGDNAMNDIGRKKGCMVYLPDVLVEQMHFSNGKAPLDKTYEKPEAWDDRRVYEEWRLKNIVKPVNFVCLKAGNLYDANYVNTLYDMVRRNIVEGYPGAFYCITDDSTGLDPAIRVIPLPADLERWWGKLFMFQRGLFPDGARCIFMDLDTAVVGILNDLVKYNGPFATLKDLGGGDLLGPAVIAWEAGEEAGRIWDEWVASGKPRNPRGDQWWLSQFKFKHLDILQEMYPGDFVSFKYDCKPMFPKGAKVVCFHGEPRPHNCTEEWVVNCWKVGGGTAAELTALCNTHREQIMFNVRSSMKRGLTTLGFVEAHDGQAVLVGGGPSLRDPKIRRELEYRHRLGQTIFALNGAGHFLIEHGITPQHCVIVDARPENVRFVTPIHTFIASHCDPTVFDAARSATVFHVNHDAVPECLEGESILISTGSTVGLITLGISHVLGYRKFHLYGFDSSFTDEHHAYAQPENDRDAVIEVTAAGRKFRCAPWMLLQVQQFQSLAAQLAEEGCVITVAGDGLLPHVARAMSNFEEAA
ncbi:MAG TPA: DUF115 domain-containing protein, partial [Gemmatales bacterium]|nr:DUF115 domain-containing protein [Gemmatales bacterium]